MASTCCRLALCFVAVASVACSPRDVELFPDVSVSGAPDGGAGPDDVPTPAAERCDAMVPEGLLGSRPPMGWNGWTTFECDPELDEGKVRQMMTALVESGMQTAGYTFVNLDRCWGDGRDDRGNLVLDADRLPRGIEELSSDLHSSGFKLGFHRHSIACATVPSDREVADAETYASWGVDLLKLVSCADSAETDTHGVGAMARALQATGRDIVLSLALAPSREWMRELSHLARTGPPIAGTWESILSHVDATSELAAYARPGFFNDPDFLVAGIGMLSEAEQRAHFSLWSIFSAPLIASNDLSRMSEATARILTNPDLIAMNQDPLGLQAALIRRDGDLEIYAKPLAECGARGLVLFNRGTNAIPVSLTWPEIWLAPELSRARDVWSGEELPVGLGLTQLRVEPHDVRALKVLGSEPALGSGTLTLSRQTATYEANGYGPVERDTSVGEQAAGDGQTLRMRGRAYTDGLGVHAPSLVRFRLGGRCSSFSAQIGIDDETGGLGSAVFEVWSDGEKLFDSGIVTGRTPPRQVEVSLSGRQDLRLFVGTTTDGFEHDHADWAEARLQCATGSPGL